MTMFQDLKWDPSPIATDSTLLSHTHTRLFPNILMQGPPSAGSPDVCGLQVTSAPPIGHTVWGCCAVGPMSLAPVLMPTDKPERKALSSLCENAQSIISALSERPGEDYLVAFLTFWDLQAAQKHTVCVSLNHAKISKPAY